MFTGLVEAVGVVRTIVSNGETHRIRIEERGLAPGLVFGASIAVSGACLTVTESDGTTFVADVMKETWERTRFPKLRSGAKVNLERPLTPGSRIDGHFVQGHVDGVGTIKSFSSDASSSILTVTADETLLRFAVEKGSVAIDGISLTITACGTGFISVGLIPATKNVTTLGTAREGDPVNLEMDILGKYVYRFLGRSGFPAAGGVTWDLLRRLEY